MLEIKDHGHGLSNDRFSDQSASTDELGVGIPGMRQRLRQLGGRLEIDSNGNGTAVSAIVPTHSSQAAHSSAM